jgi:L-ascorbate metabolism protein UlaG (beta-lactamase superfamily)
MQSVLQVTKRIGLLCDGGATLSIFRRTTSRREFAKGVAIGGGAYAIGESRRLTKASDGTDQQQQKYPVKLTHIGTAGWEIADGKSVILLDPYYTRLKLDDGSPAAKNDKRPLYGDQDFVTPDARVIEEHAPKHVDYILVSHTHWDHALDVPYIAARTSAQIIGGESTANLALISGIKEDKIIPVKGGEDYDFDSFSVRVIPSLHTPLNNRHLLDTRVLSKSAKVPLRRGDYVEGGTYSFLIRIGGYQILTMSSVNYIERELEGLRPDILFMVPGSGVPIYRYVERLMSALGEPHMVFFTHWDKFGLPYGAPQDERITGVKNYGERLAKAYRNSTFRTLKHFESFTI